MVRNPRNAEYTKEYNRKLFLRLLRTAPMSRSEIARRMGVTRAATSKIAEELLQENLIGMTDGARVGRASAPLILRPDAGYAVGIYLNRDGCTVGIADMCGSILAKTRLHLGGEEIRGGLQPLADAVRTLIADTQIPVEKIIGAGVSAPGPLDGEKRQILNPTNFDLWHHVEVGTLLEQALRIPVYLENNASCLARFHQQKPEAQGSEDFLLLLVDSGVGSGVISGDMALKSVGNYTSEIGHVSIDFHGKPCACGNFGCLEAYAAMPHLLAGTGYTSWRAVMDSLPREDAAELVRNEADYLSAGVVGLATIIGVDTVLLAGDLLYRVETFAPILEKQINERFIRRDTLPIRVLPSCAGEDVPVQAAADMVISRFLTM